MSGRRSRLATTMRSGFILLLSFDTVRAASLPGVRWRIDLLGESKRKHRIPRRLPGRITRNGALISVRLPPAVLRRAHRSDGTQARELVLRPHTFLSKLSLCCTPHQAFHLSTKPARLARSQSRTPCPLRFFPLAFARSRFALPLPMTRHTRKKSPAQNKDPVPRRYHLVINKLVLRTRFGTPALFPCDGSRCACSCSPSATDFSCGQSSRGVRPSHADAGRDNFRRYSSAFQRRPRCSGWYPAHVTPHFGASSACAFSVSDARHPSPTSPVSAMTRGWCLSCRIHVRNHF